MERCVTFPVLLQEFLYKDGPTQQNLQTRQRVVPCSHVEKSLELEVSLQEICLRLPLEVPLDELYIVSLNRVEQRQVAFEVFGVELRPVLVD